MALCIINSNSATGDLSVLWRTLNSSRTRGSLSIRSVSLYLSEITQSMRPSFLFMQTRLNEFEPRFVPAIPLSGAGS